MSNAMREARFAPFPTVSQGRYCARGYLVLPPFSPNRGGERGGTITWALGHSGAMRVSSSSGSSILLG